MLVTRSPMNRANDKEKLWYECQNGGGGQNYINQSVNSDNRNIT